MPDPLTDFLLNPTAPSPSAQPAPNDPLGSFLTDPVGTTVREQSAQGMSWKSAEFKLKGLGVEPDDQLRQNYELTQTRKKYEGQTPYSGDTYGERFGRRLVHWMPFTESGWELGQGIKYQKAKERFDQGKATQDDYEVIAQHDRTAEWKAQQTTGEAVGEAAVRLPGMVTEFATGQAALKGLGFAPRVTTLGKAGQAALSTPLVPSMYLPGAVAQAEKSGGSPLEPKNLAPALAYGAAQMAVLGHLGGELPGNVPTAAGRLLTRTGVGLAEQQAVDTGSTALDRAVKRSTGESLGLDTGYGTIGSFVRGDDDAMKHATVQALTFAAFSAMHAGEPRPEPRQPIGAPEAKAPAKPKPDPITKTFADALDDMAQQGVQTTEASRRMTAISNRFERLLQEDPTTAWETARDLYKDERLSVPEAAYAREVGKVVSEKLKAEINAQHEAKAKRLTPENLLPEPPGGDFEGPSAVSRPVDATPAPEPAPTSPIPRPEPQNAPAARITQPEPTSLYRVPDYKTSGEGVDAAIGELVKPFAGKWASKGFEQNESYFTTGKVQFEFEPGKFGEGELQDSGKESLLGSKTPMYQHPALRSVRFKGSETSEGFGRLKGLIEDANVERASMGLEPIHLEATEKPKGESVKAPEPVKRLSPLDVLKEQHEGGQHVELSRVLDAAGLDAREQQVMGRRIAGESHDVIGKDLGVSRQRVKQIEDAAMTKLGAKGKSVAEAVHADEAASRSLDLIERGKGIEVGDLAHDPASVKRVVKRRNKGDEAKTDALDKLADQLLKEAEDGTLTETRIAEIGREAARVHQGEAVRPAKAPGAPEQLPAPTRSEAVGGEARPAAPGPRIGAPTGQPIGASQPVKKGPNTLIQAILRSGGIDASSATYLKHFGGKGGTKGGLNEVVGPKVFKKGGRDFEQLAQELENEGHIPKSDDPGATLAEMLRDKKESAQYAETATGQRDIERRAEEAARQREEDPRVKSQTFEEGEAGDEFLQSSDFAFGANADVEKTAARMLADRIADTPQRSTAAQANFGPVTPQGPSLLARAKEAAVRFGQTVRDHFIELGGGMFPRTTRLFAKAADSMARFISARQYAHELTPVLIDKVIPKGKGQPFMQLVGGVLTEMRLRYMKEAFRREGNTDAADAVQTIVGRPPDAGGDVFASPLLTEADYQHALRDPEVQQAIKAYKEHVVPIMNENFRKAEGLPLDNPGDDITNATQMPGLPVNLKRIKEGEQVGEGTVRFAGTRQGNLENPRLKRLAFARQATGASETGYHIDIGAMIDNSIALSTEVAAKADMYRTLVDGGLAKWGRSTPAGYEHLLAEARPPKGTQAAGEGEIRLYFKDESVMKEVRKALDVDLPWKAIPGTGLLNMATLASLGEFTAHSKNLLTAQFKPGMSIVGLVRNAIDVVKQTPEVRDRLVELARIGALKPKGYESQATGLLGRIGESNLNPLKWTGKVLDVLDRASRLTASEAFDTIAKREGVDTSEGSRRDFINQLGQYNKRAQSHVVRFLRDTGLGPFATAGSNYWAQGLRSLLGGHGVRTSSVQADAALRGRMLARTAAFMAAVPVVNYLMWGNVFGDDDTPIGAIKLKDDKEGRSQYFDLTALTGVTRGMRETGLLAMAESAREQGKPLPKSSGEVADKAARDIGHAVSHPAQGPVVAFLEALTSGENTIGRRVAKPATEGESQTVNNLKAALIQANPLIAAGLQLAGRDPMERRTDVGREALRQLGPFGVKSGPTDMAQTFELRKRFLAEQGLPADTGGVSKTAKMRDAALDDNYEAFAKAREAYLEAQRRGGSAKPGQDFLESVNRLDPIKGHLNAVEERKFLATLSPDQRATVDRARAQAKETRAKMLEFWRRAAAEEQKRPVLISR